MQTDFSSSIEVYNYTKPYLFIEVKDCIDQYFLENPVYSEGLVKDKDIKTFEHKLVDWLTSDSYAFVQGLDKLPHIYDTYGVTHAIQLAICSTYRKICFFKEDYLYYQTCCEVLEIPFKSIESSDQLEPGDFLFISHPFCKTGNPHPNFEDLMQTCVIKDVRVFLDCAFFGSLPKLSIKVYPCIDYMAFSLSKSFALESVRVGYLFSREKFILFSELSEYSYVSTFAMKLTLCLMERFAPSQISRKYKSIQNEICEKKQLQASECIWIGLDHNQCRISLYEDFKLLKL